jgi:lysozyme
MKKVILGLLVIVCTGAVLIDLIYDGIIRFNYPSRKEFPIVGIDISHHQGKIDWKKLQTEDISFVIIKATEGGDFKDPEFKANWENSKRFGYKVGAYHFYRLCKSGKEQAANFIQTVPADKNDLPPAIDLEFGGNCTTPQTKEEILREIQEFLDTVHMFYDKRPILYATKEFYDAFLVGEFREYPIWIRDIYWRPKLKDNRKWTFWQFANRGHLNGIDTYVDLNVYNGDTLRLE